MSGSHARSTSFSIRRRIRILTTLACALALVAGIGTLAAGHLVHGALLMLAAAVLVPGSVWGWRHRRHAPPAAALAPSQAAERRWRRAA